MAGDSNSGGYDNLNYLIAAGVFPGLRHTKRMSRAGPVSSGRPNAGWQFDLANHRVFHDCFVQSHTSVGN